MLCLGVFNPDPFAGGMQTQFQFPLMPQDLQYGVAVINSDRGRYLPGDPVKLSMAVLNDQGEMVCDANVKVTVTNLSDGSSMVLSTENGEIRVNPQCHSKDLSDVPDYEATLSGLKKGIYRIELSARSTFGYHQAANVFKIKDDFPFRIKRLTASRIYPKHKYPVTLRVRVNRDFDGEFVDKVPKNFTVEVDDPAVVVEEDGDWILLKWQVNWKKGEVHELEYRYKAPMKSPDYYEFGRPLFFENGETIFRGFRRWQVAVDSFRFLFDAASQFEANDTSYMESAYLDTDKFVVCYADSGAAGQCRVGVVTGTSISWGTEEQFVADAVIFGSAIGVCRLDTDKFAVVYTDDGQADDGYVVAGSVSGDTITFGTPVEFANTDVEWQNCAGIATDKIIIGFDDETNSDTGTGVACSASGLTMSCGALNDYAGTDYYAQYNHPAKLDDDKFVMAFRGADASDGFVVAGTTSGNTITWGSVVTITTNNVSNTFTCSPQDTDRFVVVYNNETNTAGHVVAGTTSGTVITLGSVTDFNPTSQDTGAVACGFISATKFIVTYPDVGNSSFGSVVLCTVDWSTRDTSCITEEVFASVDTLDSVTTDGQIFEILDGYGTNEVKFVVGYKDTPSTDDGNAIVGQVLRRRVMIIDH